MKLSKVEAKNWTHLGSEKDIEKISYAGSMKIKKPDDSKKDT